MKNILILFSFFGLFSDKSHAQLRLAEIFGNQMVLQQKSPALPVWGRARAGDTVFVRCSWATEVFSSQVGADGRFEVKIATPAASLEPHEVEVWVKKERIVLRNVLIGEVWLCSGQSNMEWNISDSKYTSEETRAKEFSHIRHIKVRQTLSLTPLDTLDTEGWIVCNEGSVRNFTAVGYFFARDLAERMRIPIGLINSSWGGSQVESWISAGGMRSSPLFKSYMEQFPKTWEEADAWLLSKIKKYAFGSNRPNSTAQEEAQWMAPDFDLSKWPKVFPTYAWDWQQLWAFRGSGMMAVDFNLEEQDTGADATLRLGHGDLPAEIWINGRRIWRGRNAGGIEMAIPASVLKTGTNRLVYRQKLANTKDWAEMGMRGGASDFLLKTRRDQTIPLDGYWRAVPLLSEPFYFIHSSNNLSTAIYNAMIHPIVRFPVAGVIWYQGETNAVRAEEYRTTFPLLIQDWRQTWNKELPFLFVQLANWQAGGGHSRNGGSEWAELREAQAHALHLPGTGMAVAIDIGESNDIHPRNKHDVGRRLAREARRVAYNERLLPGSPVLPEWTFSGDRTVVKYAVPLSVHGSANLVNGFELAGEDRIFHAARAEVSGNTVIIQSEAVPRPVAVRYAWADDPTGLSLYTWDDFPIAPFRSDDWPRRTAGVRFE